tara:strand:- start:118 stop:909 length:792 start_codon:yes stop_codon:yes gene_type:complete
MSLKTKSGKEKKMAKEEKVEGQDPIVEGAEASEPTPILEEQQEAEGTQEVSEVVDWEAESKKFQSMYDKKTADYENLSRDANELQQLKNLLDDRPDVVKAMEEVLAGQSQEGPKEPIEPEAFDPWDAYYKPDSPSYKMRVANEEKLVHETVDRELGKLQEAMAITNIKNELMQKHKMSDADAENFLEFATTPRGDLPLDTLVRVWRDEASGSKPNENKKAVQKAQQTPRPAGVLQGGDSPQKSEPDQVWDRIMNVGNRSKLVK